MTISSSELELVNKKLNRQNAVRAAFASGTLATPVLMVWYAFYLKNVNFAPVMLLLSGIIVGLTIRLMGRGFSRQFQVIGFFAHLSIVVSAFLLNIVIGGVISGFLLVGLYFMGAWSAVYLSRIEANSLEHRAFFHLTEVNRHDSFDLWRNRWYLSLPVTLFSTALSACLALVLLVSFDEVRVQQVVVAQKEHKQKIIEDKHIDTSINALNEMTTKQALNYAYAYYSGKLVSRNGRYFESFPRSTYKSKAILKYLVKHRNNQRASYILGVLTEGKKGKSLIKQASDAGDFYARYQDAVDFGCQYDKKAANQLLKGLFRLTKETPLKMQIQSVLSYGYDEICEEEARGFQLAYIKEYKEKI